MAIGRACKREKREKEKREKEKREKDREEEGGGEQRTVNLQHY